MSTLFKNVIQVIAPGYHFETGTGIILKPVLWSPHTVLFPFDFIAGQFSRGFLD
jgi:hypothetical protein